VSWRVLVPLALALLALGCAPAGGPLYETSRTRCIDRPGRGENYDPNRPLIFFMCVESP